MYDTAFLKHKIPTGPSASHCRRCALSLAPGDSLGTRCAHRQDPISFADKCRREGKYTETEIEDGVPWDNACSACGRGGRNPICCEECSRIVHNTAACLNAHCLQERSGFGGDIPKVPNKLADDEPFFLYEMPHRIRLSQS